MFDSQERYILRKIKRQFTNDEAVMFLTQAISKLEQEIGVLKSEKQELEFKITQMKKPTDFSKTKRILEETVYKLYKENEALRKKLGVSK